MWDMIGNQTNFDDIESRTVSYTLDVYLLGIKSLLGPTPTKRLGLGRCASLCLEAEGM